MSRRKILTGLLIILAVAIAIPFLLVLADEEGWGGTDDPDPTEYEAWDDPENYLDEGGGYGYPEYEEEEELLNLEDEPSRPEEYPYGQMDEDGSMQPQGGARISKSPRKGRSDQQESEILESRGLPFKPSADNETDELMPDNDSDLEENEEAEDSYNEYEVEAEYDGEGENELY